MHPICIFLFIPQFLHCFGNIFLGLMSILNIFPFFYASCHHFLVFEWCFLPGEESMASQVWDPA